MQKPKGACIRIGSMNHKKICVRGTRKRLANQLKPLELTLFDFLMTEKKREKIRDPIQRCVKPLHSMEKLPFFAQKPSTHKSNVEPQFGRHKRIGDENRYEKNKIGKQLVMSIELLLELFFLAVLQCHKCTSNSLSILVKWNQFRFEKRSDALQFRFHGFCPLL